MVQYSKPQRSLYVFDGFNLLIVWGKGFLKVFKSVDALSIHCGNLREQFQLGSHHFQVVEYQHPIGLNTKIWRNIGFLHGILLIG